MLNMNTVRYRETADGRVYDVLDSLGRVQASHRKIRDAAHDAGRRCRYGMPLDVSNLCRADSPCQEEHAHYAAVTGELASLSA